MGAHCRGELPRTVCTPHDITVKSPTNHRKSTNGAGKGNKDFLFLAETVGLQKLTSILLECAQKTIPILAHDSISCSQVSGQQWGAMLLLGGAGRGGRCFQVTRLTGPGRPGRALCFGPATRIEPLKPLQEWICHRAAPCRAVPLGRE